MLFKKRRAEIEAIGGRIYYKGSAAPPPVRWPLWLVVAALMGVPLAFIGPFMPRRYEDGPTFKESTAQLPPSSGDFVEYMILCAGVTLSILTLVHAMSHVWFTEKGIVFGGVLPWFKLNILPIEAIDPARIHTHDHPRFRRRHLEKMTGSSQLSGQMRWLSKRTLALHSGEVRAFRDLSRARNAQLTPGWFYFGVNLKEVVPAIDTAIRAKAQHPARVRATWDAGNTAIDTGPSEPCAFCRLDMRREWR